MLIDIKNFTGTAPSVAKQSLADTMATIALNCRLGSTEVRPCSRMRPDHYVGAVIGSIYQHDDTWVERTATGYRFAPSPVETDPQRLYITAPAGGATVWVDEVETTLGVVPPVAAPGVSASGGSGTAETRVYLFTCVSALGEESAPSPASAQVDVLPGGTASLTGMNTPTHTGYSTITYKRIYRSAVGTSGLAGYFFVAQIAAAATTYDDTVAVSALGETLPSLGWALPPADLKGLTAMPGGFLAGFSGREIRFCEPWQPHAWPDKYSNAIQHDIVQLGASGRTLFALTTGPVYFVTVNDIETAVPEMMPGDVPAVSENAVVNTPTGVVFASKDGLYLAAPGVTSPALLSRGFYSERDWTNMNPSSMFGAWHADQLFMFFTNAYSQRGGMIFDSITTSSPVLRFTDVPVDAAVVVPDGRLLYLVSDGYVYEWEGDSSFGMDATWASKEFVTACPVNFAAALVDADYAAIADPDTLQDELDRQFTVRLAMNGDSIGGSMGMHPVGWLPFASDMLGLVAPFFNPDSYVGNSVEFQIFGDGILRYSYAATSDLPFVLPSGYSARKWTVQVKSKVNVKRIAVGESIGEIYS